MVTGVFPCPPVLAFISIAHGVSNSHFSAYYARRFVPQVCQRTHADALLACWFVIVPGEIRTDDLDLNSYAAYYPTTGDADSTCFSLVLVDALKPSCSTYSPKYQENILNI